MVGASGLERCGDDEERSGGRICDCDTETTAAKGKRRSCGLIWASGTGLPDDSGGAAVGSPTDGSDAPTAV